MFSKSLESEGFLQLGGCPLRQKVADMLDERHPVFFPSFLNIQSNLPVF